MYLLITESPAKAKKIQGFLSNEYTPTGNVQDKIKLIIGETE